MELAETAQELGVRGMRKPALADKGSSDERGGEADADDDLPEEVVIVENLGDCHRLCCGMPLHVSLHTHRWFLQMDTGQIQVQLDINAME